MRRRAALGAAVLAISAAVSLAAARPASASIWKPICSVLGVQNPIVNPCSIAHHGITIVKTGAELANGNVGGAVQSAASGATSAALGVFADWATAGARYALDETARLVAASISPSLAAPWFTTVYWRFVGVAALLTLPFLFAAAVQALIRSDLSLLVRSAFGYLPLAMLGISVAAQLTALLLAATDELCAAVSGVAGNPAPAFLAQAGSYVAALSFASASPFLALLVSVFTVAGAIVLWLELVMRAAAVYVIVVMLPLAFAALVWPARRVWALRAVELLVALILSKLAIVAVLTLGGAALAQQHTAAAFLTGLTLLLLGAFAPWAMLRFVPFAELAAGAAGRLRAEASAPVRTAREVAQFVGSSGHDWASDVTARMRRDLQRSDPGEDPRDQLAELGRLDRGGGGSEPGVASDLPLPPPQAPSPAPAHPPASEHSTPPAPEDRPASSDPLEPEEVPGEQRVSLLADEVGPNGERRPGMAARWQAADRTLPVLQLGIEHWSRSDNGPPEDSEP